MSLFKRLKGVIIEVDETSKEKSVEKAEDAQQRPVVAQPVKSLQFDSETEIQKIHDTLMTTVTENQTLYGQFIKMVESLSKIIADKAQCYAAAFAAISQTNQATVEELIQSIETCINDLEIEKQKFHESATTHQEEVDQLKQQLQAVEQQIADLEERRKNLAEEITVKSDKIAKTMSEFERAMSKVMSELQTERTRVHTFLAKGGD